MSEFDEFNVIPARFIDLSKSVLDEEKSDPENYVYEFKEKVYYDNDTNKFPYGYLPKWGRKTSNLHSAGIPSKLKRFGWFALKVHEHQILPEPFDKENIDENGYLVYIDAILGSIPYEKLARKRWHEIKKSDNQLRSQFASFDEKLRKDGAELDPKTREEFEEQRRKILGV